ncbi:ribonuclease III [Kordiimonas marina]|uniref:ribonuclease III n=1 Tax=Kordiimonas marina TaxID=2872312 RepID=UPI001FF36F10|nr:ribonuclease III [Kordiimonas marina]MCJ9429180.1 ribonuclease III [Kordiimonas marina]
MGKHDMTVEREIAGYRFDKVSLLEEALTHPSLSGTHNYQRLEFLGDRVLGLVISTWLLEAYPSEAEGKLNRRFTALVRKETLAEMAQQLGIAAAIMLTPGAEAEGTRDKEAVQADACEAVIGAMYLDSGYRSAEKFIRKFWAPLMKDGPGIYKDSKTQLQEWCQARGLPLPVYKMAGREGPDHNPVFTIEAQVDGKGSASASGSAKRQAEQAAAEELLMLLTGE